MKPKTTSKLNPAVLDRKDFPHLLEALKKKGYDVIGPTVHDGSLVYDELTDTSQLPIGWGDEQTGGKYRLKKRSDAALFGFNSPQQSWKQFLLTPRALMWQGKRDSIEPPPCEEPPHLAFLGVRACDVQAILRQDKVMMGGPYPGVLYAERRQRSFIVAVNCTQASGTCFCASMGTGPKNEGDFDLCLTEILEGSKHWFLMEAGSKRGEELLKGLPQHDATPAEIETAEKTVAKTADHMGRKLDTKGLKEILYANPEHPRWSDVANRCMTCGNCTMVCPTCFCTSMEDVTDLTGQEAQRWRRWDSCFTLDFSYIHGGSVRVSGKSRYRQWLTHKLGTWQDQFGSIGCVGCGRCISWCPVGIDITEEATAIRNKPVTQEVHDGNN